MSEIKPINLDLVGRIALITGAGQGIGRILAQAYAAAGAKVVLADLGVEKAHNAASEIRTLGGEALAVPMDVSSERSVSTALEQIENTWGSVDILVNNASVFSTLKMQPFDEISLDVWNKVLAVNLTGSFLCARAVVPGMRAKGWGRIINIASGAVNLGRPNYLHYIASKSGVIGMSRSMARELGPHGITVNSVLPGSVDTGIQRETVTPESKARIVAMQCVPRGQVPDDLVGIALFLASEASSFITGQSLTVDGGATHN